MLNHFYNILIIFEIIKNLQIFILQIEDTDFSRFLQEMIDCWGPCKSTITPAASAVESGLVDEPEGRSRGVDALH